jgi:hypothetical protein
MVIMVKFSSWLYKISSNWVTLSALILFLLFTALILPRQTRQAEQYSSDLGSPDLSFYYSAQTLYDLAEQYGESGRDAYVYARFTFDLVWPLVYTTFLVITISWVLARLIPSGNQSRLLNLTPFTAMVFDFLENIATSVVMVRYPNQIPIIANLAPIFTMVKWLLVATSISVLLIGLFLLVWRWLARKISK